MQPLNLRDCMKRRKHFAGLRRGLLPRTQLAQLAQRRRVYGTVLAHLELGQVEPEGLRLPDQVLKLAIGLPACARFGEGTLDETKVADEFGRRLVPERVIVLLKPSRLKPPRRVQHEGTKRLAR